VAGVDDDDAAVVEVRWKTLKLRRRVPPADYIDPLPRQQVFPTEPVLTGQSSTVHASSNS
jgi:hypothetical protein